MIAYILQVYFCWTLFYVIYHFALRKETFFVVNRYYLLSSVLIGLVIPLLGGFFQGAPVIEPLETSAIVYEVSQAPILLQQNFTAIEQSKNWWPTILISIYAFGVLVGMLKMGLGLARIWRLYQNGNHYKRRGYTIVETTKAHLPFSFMQWVFISAVLPLPERFENVLEHEKLHVKQWHTVDVLLLQVIHILFWFNPILILYKKALQRTHEFLADETVLKNTTKVAYGNLLMGQHTTALEMALTNQFFNSQIKNRIQMMYREQSKKSARWKYTFALPILLIAVVLFSNAMTPQNEIDRPALYPGCDLSLADEALEECAQKKLLKHLYSEIKYPVEAREAFVMGQVVVKIPVNKTGAIGAPSIVKDLGYGLGEEVLRTVNTLRTKDWIPAIKNGKAVNEKLILPVSFRLQNDLELVKVYGKNDKEELGRSGQLLEQIVVTGIGVWKPKKGTEDSSNSVIKKEDKKRKKSNDTQFDRWVLLELEFDRNLKAVSKNIRHGHPPYGKQALVGLDKLIGPHPESSHWLNRLLANSPNGQSEFILPVYFHERKQIMVKDEVRYLGFPEVSVPEELLASISAKEKQNIVPPIGLSDFSQKSIHEEFSFQVKPEKNMLSLDASDTSNPMFIINGEVISEKYRIDPDKIESIRMERDLVELKTQNETGRIQENPEFQLPNRYSASPAKSPMRLTPQPELDPIFIVDGIEIEQPISWLEPDRIENVNVYKGLKAVAVAGVKAHIRGVVEITTKKGLPNTTEELVDIGELRAPLRSAKNMDSVTSRDTMKPIYILDGSRIPESTFVDVDPDEIETINVLKGKTASILYGYGEEAETRGVVEIITKANSKKIKTSNGDRIKLQNDINRFTDLDDPIFILDGEKVEKPIIPGLDPDEILSIDILKENSAKALYGEVASERGVVIITTKNHKSKGKKAQEMPKELALPATVFPKAVTTLKPNKDEKPIYVLNGEIVDKHKIDKIDTEDIETINVRKGKAAIAIYGKEAGVRGVVEITSKPKKHKRIKSDKKPKQGKTYSYVPSDKQVRKVIPVPEFLPDFKAYPNPASEEITIEFTSAAEPILLKLTSLDGKTLYSMEIDDFQGTFNETIQIPDAVSSGVVITILQGTLMKSEYVIIDKHK